MAADYKVIVAGGSVSGLFAARELAAAGISVAVLEEDHEIGTPEHCGGLVSMNGIRNLGMVPDAGVLQNTVKRARVFSKSHDFELDAQKQQIVVIDRRAFDKQIAFQAQRMGADIKVRCAMRSVSKGSGRYAVSTTEGELVCDYFVDARGVASIIHRNRTGILQSAQYELYAPWIEHDTVKVMFDSEKYPGFFAWIIPTADGCGKVGVAGRSINAARSLQSFISSMGSRYSVTRKIYAPIWIMGPLESFVDGRTVIVGDAAGQTKPTTAGGIYSCGMGGIFAGKSIASAIERKDDAELRRYQQEWSLLFREEFQKMLLARRLLERLDNKAIDEMFSAIPSDKLGEVSAVGDFDFHSIALTKLLGTRTAVRVAKAILGNEIRRLID